MCCSEQGIKSGGVGPLCLGGTIFEFWDSIRDLKDFRFYFDFWTEENDVVVRFRLILSLDITWLPTYISYRLSKILTMILVLAKF